MSIIKIAPSILSADFNNLGREVKRIEKAGADLVHIDVMDGHFVPNIAGGLSSVEALRKVTNLPLDVHLMISNPELYIDKFCEAGADYLTIHQEATAHLDNLLRRIKGYGVKAGVALNPGTNPSVIPDYIYTNLADMVLVMSVNPGFGGQEFIPRVLDSIKYIRSKSLNLDIEVDGGIDYEVTGKRTRSSAHLTSNAGANILVAGSAVFGREDYKNSISRLRKAFRERANH